MYRSTVWLKNLHIIGQSGDERDKRMCTLLLNLMEELSPCRQLEATLGFSAEEINSPESILYVTADFNIHSLVEGSGSSQFNLDLHCSHAAGLAICVTSCWKPQRQASFTASNQVTTGGSWWCETGHIAESLSSIYWLSNCESLVFVSVNEPGLPRREVAQRGMRCYKWAVSAFLRGKWSPSTDRFLRQTKKPTLYSGRPCLFIYEWHVLKNI